MCDSGMVEKIRQKKKAFIESTPQKCKIVKVSVYYRMMDGAMEK